jgi:hypothetical protein
MARAREMLDDGGASPSHKRTKHEARTKVRALRAEAAATPARAGRVVQRIVAEMGAARGAGPRRLREMLAVTEAAHQEGMVRGIKTQLAIVDAWICGGRGGATKDVDEWLARYRAMSGGMETDVPGKRVRKYGNPNLAESLYSGNEALKTQRLESEKEEDDKRAQLERDAETHAREWLDTQSGEYKNALIASRRAADEPDMDSEIGAPESTQLAVENINQARTQLKQALTERDNARKKLSEKEFLGRGSTAASPSLTSARFAFNKAENKLDVLQKSLDKAKREYNTLIAPPPVDIPTPVADTAETRVPVTPRVGQAETKLADDDESGEENDIIKVPPRRVRTKEEAQQFEEGLAALHEEQRAQTLEENSQTVKQNIARLEAKSNQPIAPFDRESVKAAQQKRSAERLQLNAAHAAETDAEKTAKLAEINAIYALQRTELAKLDTYARDSMHLKPQREFDDFLKNNRVNVHNRVNVRNLEQELHHLSNAKISMPENIAHLNTNLEKVKKNIAAADAKLRELGMLNAQNTLRGEYQRENVVPEYTSVREGVARVAKTIEDYSHTINHRIEQVIHGKEIADDQLNVNANRRKTEESKAAEAERKQAHVEVRRNSAQLKKLRHDDTTPFVPGRPLFNAPEKATQPPANALSKVEQDKLRLQGILNSTLDTENTSKYTGNEIGTGAFTPKSPMQTSTDAAPTQTDQQYPRPAARESLRDGNAAFAKQRVGPVKHLQSVPRDISLHRLAERVERLISSVETDDSESNAENIADLKKLRNTLVGFKNKGDGYNFTEAEWTNIDKVIAWAENSAASATEGPADNGASAETPNTVQANTGTAQAERLFGPGRGVGATQAQPVKYPGLVNKEDSREPSNFVIESDDEGDDESVGSSVGSAESHDSTWRDVGVDKPAAGVNSAANEQQPRPKWAVTRDNGTASGPAADNNDNNALLSFVGVATTRTPNAAEEAAEPPLDTDAADGVSTDNASTDATAAKEKTDTEMKAAEETAAAIEREKTEREAAEAAEAAAKNEKIEREAAEAAAEKEKADAAEAAAEKEKADSAEKTRVAEEAAAKNALLSFIAISTTRNRKIAEKEEARLAEEAERLAAATKEEARIAEEAERLSAATKEEARLAEEAERLAAATKEEARIAEEAERLAAATKEEARIAEEEAKRLEAVRLAAEEAARLAAEEAERVAEAATKEAARLAADEAAKAAKVAEAARLAAEEAANVAETARLAAEAEALRLAAENATRAAAKNTLLSFIAIATTRSVNEEEQQKEQQQQQQQKEEKERQEKEEKEQQQQQQQKEEKERQEKEQCKNSVFSAEYIKANCLINKSSIVPPIGSNIVPPIGSNIVPPIGSNIVPPIGSNIVPPIGSNIVPPIGSTRTCPIPQGYAKCVSRIYTQMQCNKIADAFKKKSNLFDYAVMAATYNYAGKGPAGLANWLVDKAKDALELGYAVPLKPLIDAFEALAKMLDINFDCDSRQPTGGIEISHTYPYPSEHDPNGTTTIGKTLYINPTYEIEMQEMKERPPGPDADKKRVIRYIEFFDLVEEVPAVAEAEGAVVVPAEDAVADAEVVFDPTEEAIHKLAEVANDPAKDAIRQRAEGLGAASAATPKS